MREREYLFRAEGLHFTRLVRTLLEGVPTPKETPMTALVYALSRAYQAFLAARLRQAKMEIRRHKYLQ
jgi:hypothetical protein